jgi:thiol-disulfide isomerase/thioredoxin
MSPRSLAAITLAVILHVLFASAQASGDKGWYVLGEGWYVLGGDSLGIGDPAPKLTVQEFVRGEAVTEFERGKVYVIEFWKCGCPPCRAAIPHLNELQKKYPAVIFIGVGVITPTIDNKEYVKKSGNHIGYRVAIDRVPPGKDAEVSGAMIQGWLEPAGEKGVPTAFLIDGRGRIAWIGHPMDLDDVKAGKPLEQVVAGTWDLKAAAAKFAESRGADVHRRIDQLPKTERDAVHALHERAGRVEVVIRGNTVTGVRFDPRRITDAVIADLVPELRKLKGLRDLNLCGAEITDAGLQTLRELTTVTDLDISCTRVTDAGLAHL